MNQAWVDQFNAELARPDLSDFQRQVLADYQITDAEYRETQDRFGQCMADRGWAVDFHGDGGYSISASPNGPHDPMTADSNSDNQDCDRITLGVIQAFYLGMKWNPEGLTNVQLIRACFGRHGVPDGDRWGGVTPRTR